MPDTRFAVDTNFLMDLAQPKDVAHDALEVIRRRLHGVQILCVPRVIKEIVHKAQNDPSPKKRALAHEAMLNMVRAWGVFPVELDDVKNDIARSVADKLRVQGIILWEERNDALILAEAAVLGCHLLISSDEHLRGADPAQLARVLWECDVSEVVVRTPVEIVRDFGGR